MRAFVLLTSLVTSVPCLQVQEASYVVQEMRAENATMPPPFSIARVVPFDGGLRLFVSCDSPEAVQALLQRGALEAQLSDHRSEEASTAQYCIYVSPS